MNTDGTPPLTKEALRRSMREKLRATTAEQRAAWSAEIVRWLTRSDAWVKAGGEVSSESSSRVSSQEGGVVALFGGMALEPDLRPLLPWLAARGVRVVFFSITGEVMVPRQIRELENLIAGPMGVLEPDSAFCPEVSTELLDVVLVPGIAFSPLSGARLGRGKGHYDRALASVPLGRTRIGICFHLQLHDVMPCESHDVPVQALVTEKGWMRTAA